MRHIPRRPRNSTIRAQKRYFDIAAMLRSIVNDERGSVESALVLVPLLITFLIGFQLAYVAHARNQARTEIQNQASVRAISGKLSQSDHIIHIDSSGDGQNLELLVTKRSGSLLNFLPDLPGISGSDRSFGLNGIAIMESFH
jgi:hypothetical protein